MNQNRKTTAKVETPHVRTSRNTTDPILKELRSLNASISKLSDRLDKIDQKLSLVVPGYRNAKLDGSKPPAIQTTSDHDTEQKQIDAQKDSPEYQIWLQRVANGNGAVLYQRPVFEMDAAGNVVYENGKPRVTNSSDVFDLIRNQVEKLKQAWSSEE